MKEEREEETQVLSVPESPVVAKGNLDAGKQTTLTKYFSSPKTSEEESKQITGHTYCQTTLSQVVSPLKTPAKKKRSLRSTNRFVSRLQGYGKQRRNTMPGNLMMAFASNINHPAIEEGLVHRNYILVGLVQSFTNVV